MLIFNLEISGPVNWARITHKWPDTNGEQFFYIIQNDDTGEIYSQNYTWRLSNLKSLLESAKNQKYDFIGDIQLTFKVINLL